MPNGRQHIRQLWRPLVSLVLLSTLAAQAGEGEQDRVNTFRVVPQAGIEPDVVNDLQVVEESGLEPLVVAYQDYNDPWEGMNRRIFAFNDTVYRYALIPLARGYTAAVPDPVRGSVGRFFTNLREPLNLVNNTLQGDFRGSGRNLARFLTNTTAGVLGLFDPATSWLGIEADRATLDETLRAAGVGAGPYLVFPLLGPTDLRGGSARTVETLVSPVRLVVDNVEASTLIAFDNFQTFAPAAPSYLVLRSDSSDPYLYFRNQYLQGRSRDEEYGDAPD